MPHALRVYINRQIRFEAYSKLKDMRASPATRIELLEPVMARIPQGWFWMGCEIGRDDEKPVHRAWVDAFALAAYQVTNEEYSCFLAAVRYPHPHNGALEHSTRVQIRRLWFSNRRILARQRSLRIMRRRVLNRSKGTGAVVPALHNLEWLAHVRTRMSPPSDLGKEQEGIPSSWFSSFSGQTIAKISATPIPMETVCTAAARKSPA